MTAPSRPIRRWLAERLDPAMALHAKRAEVLNGVLEAYVLSVPRRFVSNAKDDAYAQGHRLACGQVKEILNFGWLAADSPRLAAERLRYEHEQ